ncbi:sigma 54-interacting transcriptional regulator [Candidatus Dependentiae bacterium]
MINLYKIISNSFYYLETIIGSNQSILILSSIALVSKIFILSILISRAIKSTKIQKTLIFLFLVLIGSMVSDTAWILTSIGKLSLVNINYKFTLFWTRISWGFYVIYYQALALFIDSLSSKKNKMGLHQKIFILISSIVVLFFLGLALYQFNCSSPLLRPKLETIILSISTIYMLFVLMPISLFWAIRRVKTENTPRILKRQLKVFIQFFIVPVIIADLIQVYPFTFLATTIANTYTVIGISTLTITVAIIFCMRKIMGLRFLNFEKHVKAPKSFHFIDDFKNILDQFAEVTSTRELWHITQNFFKDAFNIPTRRTRLYIRTDGKDKGDFDRREHYNSFDNEEGKVEHFISGHGADTKVGTFLRKNKIIIADELEFSNFYDENEERSVILQFMNNISADIFIPIFENGSSSGYIVIEKYARINSENKNAPFYSNLERDQMLVYANYLGNIIKLLQTRSLSYIIQQEKDLKEELYSKHQEINQYKESMRSFLKHNQNKKIGVIFYKNRRFSFGNQIAQDLIPVKLNTHDGHPITKKLKRIATQVMEYKAPQTCFIQDHEGEKLVVSALPNSVQSGQNNVIIIVYYPEISDLLKKKIELLKDPTKWDYLLYLETTRSGKLINELIPGNGETLLNFKIDLLKIALSKKAILIDMPDQDLIPTVEILHHISLRETLHILDLQQPTKNYNTAIKLFGINPIFGIKTDEKKPILEKLNDTGTLFIKNIHFLEIETQKLLAEFIKYGFFKVFKGEKKTFSNVRIICATNINLQTALQEGKFSKELFDELNKTSLSMPSLMTLPKDELENLTTGFTQQAIKSDAFQHMLELTESEKKKLASSCPASFAELKNKIQTILIKKSKQSAIYEEAQFDPAYDVSDPQLVEAVRLGKHALRDRKIMCMLWNKFKNQNKIAHLLGVNRSSVNRRCKEYNLI